MNHVVLSAFVRLQSAYCDESGGPCSGRRTRFAFGEDGFLPIGGFVALLRGRSHNPVRSSIAIGILISVGVELAQYAFALGLTDVDDVVLNAIGAGFGVQLWRFLSASRGWFAERKSGVTG